MLHLSAIAESLTRQKRDGGDIVGSVHVPKALGWKRTLAFAGPGFLVSVGYMDPGNWATDLAGGSRFGYTLLWVILASNLMAILLQTLCARMGIVLEKDLAQACRDYYSKPIAVILWILCELAIVACDVAEVIGSAVALQLLFGLPMVWGVILTGFDVLLLLGLMRFGFRKLEALVIALVSIIGVCFAINIFRAEPDWHQVATNLVPHRGLTHDQLLVAIGIIGATVMPHNLYLHSSIVQSRLIEKTPEAKKHAIKAATFDTVCALTAAFFVNAAILVLAAALFHKTGKLVDDLGKAHELIAPILGGSSATLFAIALLASGQSSTITGTLAGQIVMEGFTDLKMKPWIRRLLTRSLAIIPAVFLVSAFQGRSLDPLILSQVILSMQLPFAVIPLVMITSSRRKMGEFVNPRWLIATTGAICLTIVGLNIALLFNQFGPK